MSTNKMKTLAEKIRTARTDADLSQLALSKALMVSEKAVSSYEAGRTTPSIQTLEKIAKKTEKPVWYFTNEGTEDLRILKKIDNIEKIFIEIRDLLEKKKRRY